jgi:hypothetical protein
MELDVVHALATAVLPAILTLGLVWWCSEFRRPETFRNRPWYLVLIVTTAMWVALTAVVFVTEL